jgi:hypothetical protein
VARHDNGPLLLGVSIDIVFATVPDQDPTFALQASDDFAAVGLNRPYHAADLSQAPLCAYIGAKSRTSKRPF